MSVASALYENVESENWLRNSPSCGNCALYAARLAALTT
jgi:hypothetical protein